jgi:hypothetical protein
LQTTYVTSQTEPTIIGQSIAFAKTHLKSILVVYGILFASFGVLRLDQDIQGASDGVSPYRLSQLGSSMDMINHHGPPLTAARDGNPSSFYPLAIDDDRGGFVYLPLAAHFLGTRDIDALLKWSFIIFFASLLLAYPLVLYEITGSVTAAFADSPTNEPPLAPIVALAARPARGGCELRLISPGECRTRIPHWCHRPNHCPRTSLASSASNNCARYSCVSIGQLLCDARCSSTAR